MWTLPCLLRAAFTMVAIDTHALRVIALVLVRTRQDLLLAQVMIDSGDARYRRAYV